MCCCASYRVGAGQGNETSSAVEGCRVPVHPKIATRSDSDIFCRILATSTSRCRVVFDVGEVLLLRELSAGGRYG